MIAECTCDPTEELKTLPSGIMSLAIGHDDDCALWLDIQLDERKVKIQAAFHKLHETGKLKGVK